MEDYAKSVEQIEEIRKADINEKLTKLELKEYRKYAEKYCGYHKELDRI